MRLNRLPPLASGVLLQCLGRLYKPTAGRYDSALANFALELRSMDLIERVFAARGYFDWRVAVIAARVLRAGDTVYECGANIGTETFVFASAVGPHGAVRAIEPDPRLADRIRDSVELNGFENIEVVSAAVGSKDGTVQFLQSGSENSGQGMVVKSADEGITVRVVALNEFVSAKRERVDLLFMDIQGSELEALRGSATMIASQRPVLLVEVEPESLKMAGGTAAELFELLRSLGYVWGYIGRLGIKQVRHADWDSLPPGNWLAVPKERQSLLASTRTAMRIAAILPPRSRFSALSRLRGARA